MARFMNVLRIVHVVSMSVATATGIALKLMGDQTGKLAQNFFAAVTKAALA